MYSNTNERIGLADSDEGIVKYSLMTPPDIPIYNLDGTYASVIREGYTRINPIAMALTKTSCSGEKNWPEVSLPK